MNRALMWFRADLRIRDNTALSAAAEWADDGLVGVFVICPGQWKQHDWAAVKVDFILRTLRELSTSLAKVGVPLVIVEAEKFRDVPRALAGVAKEWGCSGLFFNREYEVNEARRDELVVEDLTASGVDCFAFDDQCVLAPGTVRTGEGRAFTVFTPFRNAWSKKVEESGGIKVGRTLRTQTTHPKPAAARGDAGPALGTSRFTTKVPERVAGFEASVDPGLWPAGERAAEKRLETFVDQRIGRYKTDREFPGVDGTSTLSPYLAVGAISPRQCLKAAVEWNKGKLSGGNPGADQWIAELIWREFYRHVLVAFPRVCTGRAFKSETDRIQWRYDEREFAAWCEGRTGYPIVDAAMRCLNATGWMHNRLRMVAARFLTKDLLIDWRWGEKYFMQRLVDGDFASNNGGWQWSASTGTDAAPYFRIFNPLSQSRKCDPEGFFIRKWVPELAGVSGDEVHDPSELPPLVRAGVRYPEKMVDHGEARERVMSAFAAIRG
ncbi:MAG: deoxyribodipyrimidine photo-lyase [Phycisphaeraceae bacterium]|nr:deoxyribodipyrimidine photo-lyase [Phycisphaeraceae bacterium]